MMPGPVSALRKVGKNVVDILKDRFPALDFSVSESDDVIRLNKLVVPKDQRNQGIGSEFMRELTQYADESGKPIALTADGDFGGSKAGQRRFYKRAGFEDNKGKNKDFSISEGMVRRPQARAKSPSVEELVRLGYPESTAKKIASGELPMDQASRMERAREQGFDVDQTYYHGTSGDFSEFKATGSNTNARSAKEAVWLSDDPEVAAGYARMAAEDGPISRLIKQSDEAGRRGDFDLQEKLMLQAEELEGSGQLINAGGQNIIPARVRGDLASYDVDGASMSDLDDSQLYTWLSENAGDGVKIENFDDNADWGNYRPATHVAIKDPANIRSVNAAFDPDQAGNPNLLAGSAAAAVGLGAATQSEDADAMNQDTTPEWMRRAMSEDITIGSPVSPEEEMEINRRVTERVRGGQFRRRSRQRESRYSDLRQSLLSGITQVDRAIGSAFQAIEMPYQGILGLTRTAGGLMAGESPQQALMQGAQDAQQPIDQTAYDMGGAVTDATGSPALGAAVYTGVNMGGL